MNLASISLAALIVAIAISCFTRLNVGFLSLVLAWIIATLAGMELAKVIGAFPSGLFLTLVGVTLLFTQVQVNGTLDWIAQQALRGCRGNTALVPVFFFVLSAGVSAMGPGAIATTALIAPMAMGVAGRARISAFLMALMVGNGANAGNLSPFSATGVIVNNLMAGIGLAGVEWPVFFNNFAAHAGVALAGYLGFGGVGLIRRGRESSSFTDPADVSPFEARHAVTLAVIGILIVSVLFLGVNVGMAALTCAVLLGVLRVANEADSVRRMPWGVILMVSGVTVLVALIEKTGGMDLFTAFLAHFSTERSVTGIIAFVTGFTSIFSSTSGVVLPAFLPAIPGLVDRLGGGDPFAIAYSVNVGSALVDVSPVSTIGALCLASAPHTEDRHALFNRLLAWGFSMSVVGAAICYVFFGW